MCSSRIVEELLETVDDWSVHRLPEVSTNTLPGSKEKIIVLTGRASRGEQLFHPDDFVLDKERPSFPIGRTKGGHSRNGDGQVEILFSILSKTDEGARKRSAGSRKYRSPCRRSEVALNGVKK